MDELLVFTHTIWHYTEMTSIFEIIISPFLLIVSLICSLTFENLRNRYVVGTSTTGSTTIRIHSHLNRLQSGRSFWNVRRNAHRRHFSGYLCTEYKWLGSCLNKKGEHECSNKWHLFFCRYRTLSRSLLQSPISGADVWWFFYTKSNRSKKLQSIASEIYRQITRITHSSL